MSSELIVAAFGALCVWAFQLFDKIRDRRHQKQSTLVAIASEVQAITNLLRANGYLEQYHKLAEAVRRGAWSGVSYVIDIQSNYTRVFEANASKLSMLEPEQVSKIVSFYTYGQALVDATKPNGTAVSSNDPKDTAENILGIEGILMAMLALADEIVQMPRTKLPVIRDH